MVKITDITFITFCPILIFTVTFICRIFFAAIQWADNCMNDLLKKFPTESQCKFTIAAFAVEISSISSSHLSDLPVHIPLFHIVESPCGHWLACGHVKSDHPVVRDA